MRVIVGVDVGGTNLVVGTITEDGRRIAGLQQRPTHGEAGPDAVVKQIAEMVGRSLEAAGSEWGSLDVAGVGIGSPGPIDTRSGVVVTSPNLGWHDMPLRDRVSELVGLPATLDNDASCAVLGETWRGVAQGASIVVGITVGTGIGGGIVLDGEIFHGASDVAGEVGHMTIDSTGRRCKCGNYGCLEAYASGSAIAARAVEEIESGAETSILNHVNGRLDAITAALVYQAANEDDELATEIVRDTARFLGAGVASLLNIFNPEMFVICGGVTAAGDQLFRPLRHEVKRRAFRPAEEACTITAGTLLGTAGVYGAAAVFKQQMDRGL